MTKESGGEVEMTLSREAKGRVSGARMSEYRVAERDLTKALSGRQESAGCDFLKGGECTICVRGNEDTRDSLQL
jgi:Cu/Ag efflux pump CusA